VKFDDNTYFWLETCFASDNQTKMTISTTV